MPATRSCLQGFDRIILEECCLAAVLAQTKGLPMLQFQAHQEGEGFDMLLWLYNLRQWWDDPHQHFHPRQGP